MKHAPFVLALLVACGMASHGEDLPFQNGLTFHAPFEGGAEPVVAKSPKTYYPDSLRYTCGISNMAVVPEGRGSCRYPVDGNIDLKQGSLSMWVRPVDWIGAEAGAVFLFSLQGKGRMMLGKPRSTGGDLFFLITDAKGATARVDYDIDTWQPGRWRHITATWSPKEIALYCDGKLAGRTENTDAPPTDAEHFYIGRTPSSKIGETAIDEVRIYNRALSEQDVARLHAAESRACAAAPRFPVGVESLPLRLTQDTLTIQVGDERAYGFKGFDSFAQPIALELTARIDRRACSQYYGLELRVNGRVLSPFPGNSRCYTRLKNKPFFYTYKAGGEGCWFGENWVVYYGLDWDDAMAIQTASAEKPHELHRYVFDITDLLRPDQTNTLEVRNVAYTVRNATHGSDCPLVIKDMMIRALQPEEQKLAPAYRYPPAGTVVPNPYAKADYDSTILDNGSLKITCGGRAYFVESIYSYPGGIGNGFHGDAALQREAGWQVTRDGESSITGRGKFYTIARTVTCRDNHIAIRDRITNTGAEDLGMVIKNMIRTDAPAKEVYICGNRNITFAGRLGSGDGADREDATQEFEPTFSSYNPTYFVKSETGGLGIGVFDDVVRLQSQVVAQSRSGGVCTDRFALAAGKSYDLTWKVFPIAEGGYYDFVNTIRAVEGLNDFDVHSTAVGNWYMGRWEEPRLKKWLDDRNLTYLIISAQVPGMDSKTRHGPAFMDHADTVVPEYQELARKVHKVRPGAKVLVYFSTLHFVDERDYAERAKASLKIGRSGKPLRYARDYFTVHVDGKDPYSQVLRDYIDFCLDTAGFDGIFWDVMACERERDIDYHRWDGHSAVLDENYRIKQRISIQGIEGIPFFVELIDRIYAKNKVLAVDYFSGAQTVLAALKKHRVLGMMEGNGLGRCLVRTHLHTPLTMRGGEDPTDRDRCFQQIVWNIRGNLRQANLYAFYGSWVDLKHSISTDHIFPITPVELHEGYIIGRDKIVTTRPGSYGWKKSEAKDLAVFLYNETGEKIPCRSKPYEKDGFLLIDLDLAPDYLAVIQR